MSADDTIDEFRRGKLEIDCHSMILQRRCDAGACYRGMGYIKQDESGGLVYRVYVDAHQNVQPYQHLTEIQSGRFFRDEMLFDLTAIAMDGTTWKAERLFPSVNWNLQGIRNMPAVAHGKIDTLHAAQGAWKVHHQSIHFFDELGVPLQRMSEVERNGSKLFVLDKAEFSAAGFEFVVRVRAGSGETTFNVTSSDTFPPEFQQRVQEALQYLTSTSTDWRVRLEASPSGSLLELRSPRVKRLPSRFTLPIQEASIEFRQHGWKLFADYLGYVMRDTKAHMWNPVAYYLYVAREAATSTLEAQAVGISVALEAIASLVAMPASCKERRHVRALTKIIRNQVAALPEFADLAARVDGALNGLGNKRPQDVLHYLADTLRVERAYIQSWTNLRNRHVHPKLTNLKPLDSDFADGVLSDIRKAEVLLHQLVFHLIGYSGPFTDYGALNFPSRTYPLVSASSDASDASSPEALPKPNA